MADKSAEESVRDLDNQMRASNHARHQLSDQALKLVEKVDEYLAQISRSPVPVIIEPMDK